MLGLLPFRGHILETIVKLQELFSWNRKFVRHNQSCIFAILKQIQIASLHIVCDIAESNLTDIQYCILFQPIIGRHTNVVFKENFLQMLFHKVLSCWEEIKDGLRNTKWKMEVLTDAQITIRC